MVASTMSAEKAPAARLVEDTRDRVGERLNWSLKVRRRLGTLAVVFGVAGGAFAAVGKADAAVEVAFGDGVAAAAVIAGLERAEAAKYCDAMVQHLRLNIGGDPHGPSHQGVHLNSTGSHDLPPGGHRWRTAAPTMLVGLGVETAFDAADAHPWWALGLGGVSAGLLVATDPGITELRRVYDRQISNVAATASPSNS